MMPGIGAITKIRLNEARQHQQHKHHQPQGVKPGSLGIAEISKIRIGTAAAQISMLVRSSNMAHLWHYLAGDRRSSDHLNF
jgi:hypothetical protein